MSVIDDCRFRIYEEATSALIMNQVNNYLLDAL